MGKIAEAVRRVLPRRRAGHRLIWAAPRTGENRCPPSPSPRVFPRPDSVLPPHPHGHASTGHDSCWKTPLPHASGSERSVREETSDWVQKYGT
ncbi:hypothetical protein EJB05_19351, partial [Eragrostis curvula]